MSASTSSVIFSLTLVRILLSCSSCSFLAAISSGESSFPLGVGTTFLCSLSSFGCSRIAAGLDGGSGCAVFRSSTKEEEEPAAAEEEEDDWGAIGLPVKGSNLGPLGCGAIGLPVKGSNLGPLGGVFSAADAGSTGLAAVSAFTSGSFFTTGADDDEAADEDALTPRTARHSSACLSRGSPLTLSLSPSCSTALSTTFAAGIPSSRPN